MADTSEVEVPPHTNGISEEMDDEERAKMRPADIDADVKEMERRKRVELIMNSKLFRDELERIIEVQLRDGSGTSGLMQQISDMMGVSKNAGNVFKNSNCVVPINDIRGIEAMGYAKGEKILRCKLAAVYRLIDLYGWTQGTSTLITARLNQDEEHFLVNPYGMLFHEITASSLIKADMQGNVVEQGTTNFGLNLSAYSLHAAIHSSRPDIKCIIHVHTPSVVAISALKCGLLPISQESVVIGEVSAHPYIGGVGDPEEKDKITRNLGPNNKVLLLTNQGAVCCGETIEEAFFNARNTVLASESQLKLMPMGIDNLILLNDETRKKLYEAAHKAPESSPRPDQPSILETKIERKWRVGGVEFEALMRMLDNAGFRTGYIYRHPLVKGDPPRPRSDVEVPPAVSSLGYLLEEEELYKQGLWKKLEGGRKGNDRTRWLNSPNVYQKVEILETGTPDPKKITKWVADGSPTHSSTPVKIENALQFVPKNTNPKEFKKLQQQIKDYRRADKISAGPQSHILEGVTWEEARKMQDAGVTQTGDQVVLMGAASKGIIQRGFQHNATMYKSPYAKNPFDSITDEEIDEYKKVVEKKTKGEYDTDFSESEGLSSAQINKRISDVRSPTSAASETEEESRDEPQVLRIETKQAPKPSQPEVVLSDEDEVFVEAPADTNTPPDVATRNLLMAERKSATNSMRRRNVVRLVAQMEGAKCPSYRTNSFAGFPSGSYAVPNPKHYHIARCTRATEHLRPTLIKFTDSNLTNKGTTGDNITITVGNRSVCVDVSIETLRAFIDPFADTLKLLARDVNSASSQTCYNLLGTRTETTSVTPLMSADTPLGEMSSFERKIMQKLHDNLVDDLMVSNHEYEISLNSSDNYVSTIVSSFEYHGGEFPETFNFSEESNASLQVLKHSGSECFSDDVDGDGSSFDKGKTGGRFSGRMRYLYEPTEERVVNESCAEQQEETIINHQLEIEEDAEGQRNIEARQMDNTECAEEQTKGYIENVPKNFTQPMNIKEQPEIIKKNVETQQIKINARTEDEEQKIFETQQMNNKPVDCSANERNTVGGVASEKMHPEEHSPMYETASQKCINDLSEEYRSSKITNDCSSIVKEWTTSSTSEKISGIQGQPENMPHDSSQNRTKPRSPTQEKDAEDSLKITSVMLEELTTEALPTNKKTSEIYEIASPTTADYRMQSLDSQDLLNVNKRITTVMTEKTQELTSNEKNKIEVNGIATQESTCTNQLLPSSDTGIESCENKAQNSLDTKEKLFTTLTDSQNSFQILEQTFTSTSETEQYFDASEVENITTETNDNTQANLNNDALTSPEYQINFSPTSSQCHQTTGNVNAKVMLDIKNGIEATINLDEQGLETLQFDNFHVLKERDVNKESEQRYNLQLEATNDQKHSLGCENASFTTACDSFEYLATFEEHSKETTSEKTKEDVENMLETIEAVDKNDYQHNPAVSVIGRPKKHQTNLEIIEINDEEHDSHTKTCEELIKSRAKTTATSKNQRKKRSSKPKGKTLANTTDSIPERALNIAKTKSDIVEENSMTTIAQPEKHIVLDETIEDSYKVIVQKKSSSGEMNETIAESTKSEKNHIESSTSSSKRDEIIAESTMSQKNLIESSDETIEKVSENREINDCSRETVNLKTTEALNIINDSNERRETKEDSNYQPKTPCIHVPADITKANTFEKIKESVKTIDVSKETTEVSGKIVTDEVIEVLNETTLKKAIKDRTIEYLGEPRLPDVQDYKIIEDCSGTFELVPSLSASIQETEKESRNRRNAISSDVIIKPEIIQQPIETFEDFPVSTNSVEAFTEIIDVSAEPAYEDFGRNPEIITTEYGMATMAQTIDFNEIIKDSENSANIMQSRKMFEESIEIQETVENSKEEIVHKQKNLKETIEDSAERKHIGFSSEAMEAFEDLTEIHESLEDFNKVNETIITIESSNEAFEDLIEVNTPIEISSEAIISVESSNEIFENSPDVIETLTETVEDLTDLKFVEIQISKKSHENTSNPIRNNNVGVNVSYQKKSHESTEVDFRNRPLENADGFSPEKVTMERECIERFSGETRTTGDFSHQTIEASGKCDARIMVEESSVEATNGYGPMKNQKIPKSKLFTERELGTPEEILQIDDVVNEGEIESFSNVSKSIQIRKGEGKTTDNSASMQDQTTERKAIECSESMQKQTNEYPETSTQQTNDIVEAIGHDIECHSERMIGGQLENEAAIESRVKQRETRDVEKQYGNGDDVDEILLVLETSRNGEEVKNRKTNKDDAGLFQTVKINDENAITESGETNKNSKVDLLELTDYNANLTVRKPDPEFQNKTETDLMECPESNLQALEENARSNIIVSSGSNLRNEEGNRLRNLNTHSEEGFCVQNEAETRIPESFLQFEEGNSDIAVGENEEEPFEAYVGQDMVDLITRYIAKNCLELSDVVLFPEIERDDNFADLTRKLVHLYAEYFLNSCTDDEMKTELRLSLQEKVLKALNVNQDEDEVSDRSFVVVEFLCDLLDHVFGLFELTKVRFDEFEDELVDGRRHSTPEREGANKLTSQQNNGLFNNREGGFFNGEVMSQVKKVLFDAETSQLLVSEENTMLENEESEDCEVNSGFEIVGSDGRVLERPEKTFESDESEDVRQAKKKIGRGESAASNSEKVKRTEMFEDVESTNSQSEITNLFEAAEGETFGGEESFERTNGFAKREIDNKNANNVVLIEDETIKKREILRDDNENLTPRKNETTTIGVNEPSSEIEQLKQGEDYAVTKVLDEKLIQHNVRKISKHFEELKHKQELELNTSGKIKAPGHHDVITLTKHYEELGLCNSGKERKRSQEAGSSKEENLQTNKFHEDKFPHCFTKLQPGPDDGSTISMEEFEEDLTSFQVKRLRSGNEFYWLSVTKSPKQPSPKKPLVINVDDIPLRPPPDLNLTFDVPVDDRCLSSILEEANRRLSFSDDQPEVNRVVHNEVQFFRSNTNNSSSYVRQENVSFNKNTDASEDDGDWMGYKTAKF